MSVYTFYLKHHKEVTVDIDDIEVVLTPYRWAGAVVVEWGHMEPKLNWNFITCEDEEDANMVYEVLSQHARVKMTTGRKDKIRQRTEELYQEFSRSAELTSTLPSETRVLLVASCRQAALQEQILEELIMQRETK